MLRVFGGRIIAARWSIASRLLRFLLCLIVLCATEGFIKDPRAPSIIQQYNKLSSQFFNADKAFLITVKFLASDSADFKNWLFNVVPKKMTVEKSYLWFQQQSSFLNWQFGGTDV